MNRQRGRSSGIPKYFKVIYWLGISSIIFGWLIYVPFILINRVSVGLGIAHIGITVIILCLVLWAGEATQYRPLSRRLSVAISASFIASVLATGAVGFRNSFLPQHIKVEKFTLLKEAYVKFDENKNPYLTDFEPRPNTYYELKNLKDFKMAFAIVASNFQQTTNGDFDVRGDVVLYNSSKMVADIGQLPKTSTTEEWTSRSIPSKLPAEKTKKISDVLGKVDGKMVFIQIIEQISEGVLTENNLELKIRLYDFANYSFDEKTTQLTLRTSPQ